MLEIGLKQPLLIREEVLAEVPNPFRLMFISDVHLRPRRSDRIVTQILTAMSDQLCDAVVLGGDLVDRVSEVAALTDLVNSLSRSAPVLAVSGNHDVAVGLPEIAEAVVSGGGHWIDDSSHVITRDSRSLELVGQYATGPTTSHPAVLCAHNPRLWKHAKHKGYRLVLAGHLHGCQFVACQFRNRLYPGALFYPYNYLTVESASTRLVVSRGVSDLIPVRWRCPRELVLCHV